MRKVGDLMKDLGFREDAPVETKEAFIKNLIRAAYGVEVKSPRERQNQKADQQGHSALSFRSKLTEAKQKVTASREPEQLSFSFESTDPVEGLFPKKRSGS